LRAQLDYTTRPLLSEPWILDADTTVKPLYGEREGAVVSYNPSKPCRPSHTYHSYMIGGLRLMPEVEVQPGNQPRQNIPPPTRGPYWIVWFPGVNRSCCVATTPGASRT
jgi:hypothetical protein